MAGFMDMLSQAGNFLTKNPQILPMALQAYGMDQALRAPSYDPSYHGRTRMQGLTGMGNTFLQGHQFSEQQKVREEAAKIRKRQLELLEGKAAREAQQRSAYEQAVKGMFPQGAPQIDAMDPGTTSEDMIPGAVDPRANLLSAMGPQAGGGALAKHVLPPPLSPRDQAFANLTPEQQRQVLLKPQVQIGDSYKPQTKAAKLRADRKYLTEQAGLDENAPEVKAIDREIAGLGIPSGESMRMREMVESGSRTIKTVIDQIMPKGEPDMTAVRDMWANLPFTEGRTPAAQFKEAAGLMLRLETGAQANAQEINNLAQRYMPVPWDTPETVKDKLTRFRDRFETARRIAAGGKAPGETGVPPKITTDDEYDKLPSGAEFIDPQGKRRRKP